MEDVKLGLELDQASAFALAVSLVYVVSFLILAEYLIERYPAKSLRMLRLLGAAVFTFCLITSSVVFVVVRSNIG